MKKYKLIKKYPGSPKLGTILKEEGFDENLGTYHNPKDYPEFWEEVVEKDYEILSFTDKKDSKLLFQVCKIGNKEQQEFSIKNIINNDLWNIHSVKRLSDGEIFTVGDKINTKYSINRFEIGVTEDIFTYINEGCKGWFDFKSIIKVKQPLFTTEDGVDIYEGDKFYELITSNFHNKPCIWNILEYDSRSNIIYDQEGNRKNGRIWFSTKEAGEEYILMNKPCLSIQDVLNMYVFNIDIKYAISNTKENLKEIVKERL